MSFFRTKIWNKSLKLMADAYRTIHKALLDPKNKYDDIAVSITYSPEHVSKLLCSK